MPDITFSWCKPSLRYRLFYKQILSVWCSRVLLVFTILAVVVATSLLLVQLRSLGRGDYDLVMLFRYIAMVIPSELYSIAPLACVLGTLWTMTELARENALVVMLVSGFSVKRLVACIMGAMLVLSVMLFVVGEWHGASWEKQARDLKQEAIHKHDITTIRKGQWVHSGQHWVYVTRAGQQSLYDVWDFDTRQDNKIVHAITHIDHLQYDEGGQWLAYNSDREMLRDQRIQHDNITESIWPVDLHPKDLPYFEGSWSQKTLPEISYGIKRMRHYGYAALEPRYLLWQRLWRPIDMVMLVLMILPALVVTTRHKAWGQRILGVVFACGLVTLVGAQLGLQLMTQGLLPDCWAAGTVTYLAGLGFCVNAVRYRRGQ